MTVHRLDHDMLGQLEERWRRVGAPVVEHLRPGLSADEIHSRVATLGLSPADELVTWWSWRDGVEATVALARDRWVAPRAHSFVPLDEALSVTHRAREIMSAGWHDVPDVDLDDVWPPDWLVWLSGAGAHLTLDCGADAVVAPVLHFMFEEPMVGDRRPEAPSLGTVVTWWIDAMDAGALYFDSEAGLWRSRPDLLDAEHRESVLF